MIELVLVFCMLNAPDRCMERREPLGQRAGAMECAMNAQAHAQQYVSSHPLYRLRGWRCEVDRPREAPA